MLPIYRGGFFMSQRNSFLVNLLNLEYSDIESINSTKNHNGESIYVHLSRNIHLCPKCDSSQLESKGFYKRRVSLSNNFLSGTNVFLLVPRYYCRACRSSFSDTKKMTPANQTISYQTVLQVMELLKDPKMTFSSVSHYLHISKSSVIRIFDTHCHITRATFPEVICIDEVYTKNNDFKSKYACIFYDFFNQTIIDVAPSRHKNYLHHYFQSITTGELLSVKFVCIDMYRPYKDIVKLYFKKATLCVDSFHVVKHINDDLSKLRIRIMKRYSSDSIEYYLLKNWKFLLFNRGLNLDNQAKYNKRLKRYINYRQLLDLTLSIDPDLRIGYQLKENYMTFNSTSSHEEAPQHLNTLIHDFTIANISEFNEFTNLLITWRTEIINSFIYYKGKRINNSVAESMNAKISTLLFNTKGIRNHHRRKKRIMYVINKTGFTIK